MAGHVNKQETLKQSLAAFKQWDKQWREHCVLNKPYIKTNMRDLEEIGVDKSCVCVAYGPSLEKNLLAIRSMKYSKGATVICVDKALKTLLKNDIVPDYCLLADANVPFEGFCDGVDTTKTILLAAVTANPKWIQYWKNDIYFFVNKDNINSQDIYSTVAGYNYQVPAASNVGNALVVISHSVFNFSQIFLFAFDYSWSEKKYYGGDDSVSSASGPGNKKKYNMNHMRILDAYGNLVSTSVNLSFSARWLMSYLQAFKVPVLNCTGSGIVDVPKGFIQFKEEI